MKLAPAAFLALLALVLSPVAGVAQAAPVNYYTLHFHGEFGYGEEVYYGYGAGDSYYVSYSNPGPTLRSLDNETIHLSLYADDEYSHAFFIDMNNDTLRGQDDPTQPYYYHASYPGAIDIALGAGTYVYRDATNTTWYGLIVVEQHVDPPQTWWRWDPFFIFGLFMVFAVVGWVMYVVVHAIRITRAKRKIRATNPGILKWLKVVMDPESPTRPTEQYVNNIRLERKKLRKAREAEMKQSRDPPRAG